MSDDEGVLPLEAPQSTPDEVEEGAPLWMATFGDMMSLLLVFFILMYSMSELKQEQFQLASQSLNEALGGTALVPIENPAGLLPDPVDPELALEHAGMTDGAQEEIGDGEIINAESGSGGPSDEWVETFAEAYMGMIASRLEEFIEEHDLQEQVEVAQEGEGVYLRIETVVLFRSGEAVLQPGGVELMEYLSLITRELDVPVSVSGHADNRPIQTAQFPSNWELSAARAAGVARILVAEGQDPAEIRVESYGEFKPVAENDTPEGRSSNRRVELFYAKADIVEAARVWSQEGVLEGDEPSDDPETVAAAPGEAAPDETGTDRP